MLDGGRAERDRVTRECGNLKSQIQKGRPRPITKGRTDSARINLHFHISLAIWFSPATIRPCSRQDHVSKLVSSSRRQLNQICYFPVARLRRFLTIPFTHKLGFLRASIRGTCVALGTLL